MDEDCFIVEQIANLSYLEGLYQESQQKNQMIEPSFQKFFNDLDQSPDLSFTETYSEENKIEKLIDAYRRYGHFRASIYPIPHFHCFSMPSSLDLNQLGFQEQDLSTVFNTHGLLDKATASLQEIIDCLNKRYCQTVGFEFTEIRDRSLKQWIQEQIESGYFDQSFSADDRLLIANSLIRTELLENFLHTKFVGKKRFSLEGGESLIPMLLLFVNKAAEEGIEKICFGMAHRGRTSVLANILKRPLSDVFNDFDEEIEPSSGAGTGDMRYHKGYLSSKWITNKGQSIHLSVSSNPSHLESVDTVVEGQTKAYQIAAEFEKNDAKKRILSFLIHGDAALSGQGIVYELLQLNKLKGYETGGTIHLVINNQVGFTATPLEGRSTFYCTDIARAFDIPVFHLNTDDPETCVRTLLFALEIRQRFHCDVFIDLNCYRKYGHNEGDEPDFTHPADYRHIRQKKTSRQLYMEYIEKNQFFDVQLMRDYEQAIKKEFLDAYEEIKGKSSNQIGLPAYQKFDFKPVKTAVSLERLLKISQTLATFPSHLHLHSKLEKLIKDRQKMIEQDQVIDWGVAEVLAYSTLLYEGTSVRLSGQDSRRGTFSHRHAIWIDQQTHEVYSPLANLCPNQGRFDVWNSCLSETGVMGFEYGYSTIAQNSLTIWEAQFGDFVNSAQVMIDQYISAGEQKWNQTSDLVLFLPHGFEGQGPEHSSGRLERFLSLAAHDNMQIVNPTTPAQFFHLLRRQVKQKMKKPLIVMTPKGLLRHPDCISPLVDLTNGQFYPILDDLTQPLKATRLVLCSGRVYYDLDAYRQKNSSEHVIIVRVEQLYPLDETVFKDLLKKYPLIKSCVWVQEEPQNMGSWSYMAFHLQRLLPSTIPYSYIGRQDSASPATGFPSCHKKEQLTLLQQVFQTCV